MDWMCQSSGLVTRWGLGTAWTSLDLNPFPSFDGISHSYNNSLLLIFFLMSNLGSSLHVITKSTPDFSKKTKTQKGKYGLVCNSCTDYKWVVVFLNNFLDQYLTKSQILFCPNPAHPCRTGALTQSCPTLSFILLLIYFAICNSVPHDSSKQITGSGKPCQSWQGEWDFLCIPQSAMRICFSSNSWPQQQNINSCLWMLLLLPYDSVFHHNLESDEKFEIINGCSFSRSILQYTWKI